MKNKILLASMFLMCGGVNASNVATTPELKDTTSSNTTLSLNNQGTVETKANAFYINGKPVYYRSRS